MITTVTLNVAADKLYLVDKFQAGKVNRVRECQVTAGGKGINVARVATILGEEVIATGIIGGYTGQYVESMLKSDGIRSDFLHVGGETRSCINIIDTDGKSTELLEPGVTITQDDVSNFLAKYKETIRESTVVVLSGSMPRGCKPELYAELIRIAKSAGKQVILDSSGENLRQGVQERPTMIKPNKDEIQALLGTDVNSLEEVIAAAKALYNTGIPYVAVSLGKSGAVMIGKEGVFQGVPPEVKVVNTVGCGDSMIAAFAVGFARGYTADQSLKFALAVSSANAMCQKTGFLYPSDLQKILSGGTVTRLS